MLFGEAFCEEIGPIGGLGCFDGFEVAEFGLPCRGVGGGGLELFGSTGSFCELLSESGEQWGPPSSGPWRGA